MHNFGSLICRGFSVVSFNAVKQENWIIFHQKAIQQIQQFQCKFFQITSFLSRYAGGTTDPLKLTVPWLQLYGPFL